MPASATLQRPADFPEDFDPVETAARLLRNPVEVIVAILLVGIVLYADRAERMRKAELASVLENAPIDDEPLSDEQMEMLAKPIDYTDASSIDDFRAELRAERAARA